MPTHGLWGAAWALGATRWRRSWEFGLTYVAESTTRGIEFRLLGNNTLKLTATTRRARVRKCSSAKRFEPVGETLYVGAMAEF